MKHGRRHKTLKEQTYARRFQQGAPGYASEYAPIDVAEPAGPVAPPPEPEVPLAARLSTKERKRLRHLGIEPEDE